MICTLLKFFQKIKGTLLTITGFIRDFVKKTSIKFNQHYVTPTRLFFNRTRVVVVDTAGRTSEHLRIVVDRALDILELASNFAEEKRRGFMQFCSVYSSRLLNKIILLLCLAALTVLFLINFTLGGLPVLTYLPVLTITTMPSYLLLQMFVFSSKTYAVPKHTAQNQRFWKTALMLF